jgi:hypothetical protein
MHHVRLAGIAALALVIFGGEAEGLLERRQVVFRTVLADLAYQLGIKLFHRVKRRRWGYNSREADGLGSHCTLDCSRGGD